MLEKITELELDREYSFDVIYREGDAGYAATLILTPQQITFKVMSERKTSLGWNDKEARCEGSRNSNFFLKGMTCKATRSSAISHSPSVSFYEVEFTVESVILCPEGAPGDGVFYAVNIISETIADWIGYTKTQDKILEASAAGLDVWGLLTEFSIEVNEMEALGVEYKGVYSHSPSLFNQSFTFPPSLFYILGFDHALDPFSAYIKVYNLLSFLCGFELSVQRVALDYDVFGHQRSASLYFTNPRGKVKPSRSVLFPLGKDLRFNHAALPPFPLASFAHYFSPDSDLPDILDKYVKYRSMGNGEDRLLGYFRLLEKHCYSKKNYLSDDMFSRFTRVAKGWAKANGVVTKEIKSFEKGLKRFNGQKYNTEKCLKDFLRSLPSVIRVELGISEDNLLEACTLRNNITHANKYERDELRIRFVEVCIHHLLIFALLQKLEVPLDGLANLPRRIR